MRLIIRFFVHKLVLKLAESKYKKIIFFCIYLALSCVCLYTIWYNLRDFGHMTSTQIIGLVILIPFTLIFLLGAVFSTGLAGRDPATVLSRNAGRIDEDHPLYQADDLGKNIFAGAECEVYHSGRGFFVSSPHAVGQGFQKYGRFYIRHVEPEELGEVYTVSTCYHYKGHVFSRCYRSKNGQTVVLYTMDFRLADELHFQTVGKSEYELEVPMEEVRTEEVRNLVDLNQVLKQAQA